MQLTPSNRKRYKKSIPAVSTHRNNHGPVFQGMQCGRIDIGRRQLKHLTIHTTFYRGFLQVFSKTLHYQNT